MFIVTKVEKVVVSGQIFLVKRLLLRLYLSQINFIFQLRNLTIECDENEILFEE